LGQIKVLWRQDESFKNKFENNHHFRGHEQSPWYPETTHTILSADPGDTPDTCIFISM
jgi:hypothetical protein